MAESEPVVTVAICTRNRRDELLRALASLARQGSVCPWEILVVDNAGEDDSVEAALAFADELPVPLRAVREPRLGLSHARNRALAEGRGRAVVYIDDDVTCRPGWLDAHARAFTRRGLEVLATGGPIHPVLPEGLDPAWRAVLETSIGGPTGRYDFGPEPQEIPGPNGVLLPFGGNLGVRRTLALAAGGFRTDLGWGARRIPGEETEFLRRLTRNPGRILYVPGAAVDHHVDAERASRAYDRRWNRGYGRSLARLDPPASAGDRIRRASRQLARALWWTLRPGGHLARREAERSLGHALELLRRP